MKAGLLTVSAPERLCLVFAVLLGCSKSISGQAGISGREEQERQHVQEDLYKWSVWSPCSRTCGTGIQYRRQICIRRNRDLCVEQPRKYQACNFEACPPGSPSFRDVQCSMFNSRDIFINGGRAKWISFVRGDNQCMLFCYPYGGQLFYSFGRAKDGTPCSSEPNGVCVLGRCKPVGCDQRLESGIYQDKCRVCGGNSSTCEPVRGEIIRPPSRLEKLSGYAELMVIPKGSTNVFLSDRTWNYLAVRRQNGEYVVNGHRIVSWSGWYNVGGLKVKYKRFKDNIRETIEIFGPTNEDIYVTSLLITGKLNTTFEYWKPKTDAKDERDASNVKLSPQDKFPDSVVEWGRWTACSASCGGGIKVRARSGGRETEVKRCNNVPCDKMTAKWSEWGQWDGCSATCGGGARIRFRFCKKPSTAAVRSSCTGERYAVELCNVQECRTEKARPTTDKSEGDETTSSSQMFSVTDSLGARSTLGVIFSSNVEDKFSELYKTIQTRSSLVCSSAVHQSYYSISSTDHSVSTTASKLDIRKEETSVKPKERVSETGYEMPESSDQSTLHSSSVTFSYSSIKEDKTSYASNMLTEKQKATSISPSKSLAVVNKSSHHYHKISSLAAKLNGTTLLVDQSKATPNRRSTGFLSTIPSTNIYTQTRVVTIPVVWPSPVLMERHTITKRHQLSTYSTVLVTVLRTSESLLLDIISSQTISSSLSETSSSVSDRQTPLKSVANHTSRSSGVFGNTTSHERSQLVSSSEDKEGDSPASYSVSLSDNKGVRIQYLSTTKASSSVLPPTSALFSMESSVVSSELHEKTADKTLASANAYTLKSHSREAMGKSSKALNPFSSTISIVNTHSVVLTTPFSELKETTLFVSPPTWGTVEKNSTIESSHDGPLLPVLDSDSSSITASTFMLEDISLQPTMKLSAKITTSQAVETSEQSSASLGPNLTTQLGNQSHFFLSKSVFIRLNQTVIKDPETETSASVGPEWLSSPSPSSVQTSIVTKTRSQFLTPSPSQLSSSRQQSEDIKHEPIIRSSVNQSILSSITSIKTPKLFSTQLPGKESSMPLTAIFNSSIAARGQSLSHRTASASLSSSQQVIFSSSFKYNLLPKEEVVTMNTEPITAASFGKQTLLSKSSHLRSEVNETITTHIGSLSRLSARISMISFLPSRSKSFLKEEADTSQKDIVARSSLRQHGISPLPPELSSTLLQETKTEPMNYYTSSSSSRASLPPSTTYHTSSVIKGESVAVEMEPLSSSSSGQRTRLLSTTGYKHEEVINTSHISASSPSRQLKLSSGIPQIISAPIEDALSNYTVPVTSIEQPLLSLATSSSEKHRPFSMFPPLNKSFEEKRTTSKMLSVTGVSSKNSMLPPTPSSLILGEVKTSHMSSALRSSSRQSMPSLFVSSVLKRNAMTKYSDALKSSPSRQPISPLMTVHYYYTSVKQTMSLQSTPSLKEEIISKHRDLATHSFSGQHTLTSMFEPFSLPLKEGTIIKRTKSVVSSLESSSLSSMTEEAAAKHMGSVTSSSLRQLITSSKFKQLIPEVATSSKLDSFTISRATGSTQSSMFPLSSLVIKAGALISHMDLMASLSSVSDKAYFAHDSLAPIKPMDSMKSSMSKQGLSPSLSLHSTSTTLSSEIFSVTKLLSRKHILASPSHVSRSSLKNMSSHVFPPTFALSSQPIISPMSVSTGSTQRRQTTSSALDSHFSLIVIQAITLSTSSSYISNTKATPTYGDSLTSPTSIQTAPSIKSSYLSSTITDKGFSSYMDSIKKSFTRHQLPQFISDLKQDTNSLEGSLVSVTSSQAKKTLRSLFSSLKLGEETIFSHIATTKTSPPVSSSRHDMLSSSSVYASLEEEEIMFSHKDLSSDSLPSNTHQSLMETSFISFSREVVRSLFNSSATLPLRPRMTPSLPEHHSSPIQDKAMTSVAELESFSSSRVLALSSVDLHLSSTLEERAFIAHSSLRQQLPLSDPRVDSLMKEDTKTRQITFLTSSSLKQTRPPKMSTYLSVPVKATMTRLLPFLKPSVLDPVMSWKRSETTTPSISSSFVSQLEATRTYEDSFTGLTSIQPTRSVISSHVSLTTTDKSLVSHEDSTRTSLTGQYVQLSLSDRKHSIDEAPLVSVSPLQSMKSLDSLLLSSTTTEETIASHEASSHTTETRTTTTEDSLGSSSLSHHMLSSVSMNASVAVEEETVLNRKDSSAGLLSKKPKQSLMPEPFSSSLRDVLSSLFYSSASSSPIPFMTSSLPANYSSPLQGKAMNTGSELPASSPRLSSMAPSWSSLSLTPSSSSSSAAASLTITTTSSTHFNSPVTDEVATSGIDLLTGSSPTQTLPSSMSPYLNPSMKIGAMSPGMKLMTQPLSNGPISPSRSPHVSSVLKEVFATDLGLIVTSSTMHILLPSISPNVSLSVKSKEKTRTVTNFASALPKESTRSSESSHLSSATEGETLASHLHYLPSSSSQQFMIASKPVQASSTMTGEVTDSRMKILSSAWLRPPMSSSIASQTSFGMNEEQVRRKMLSTSMIGMQPAIPPQLISVHTGSKTTIKDTLATSLPKQAMHSSLRPQLSSEKREETMFPNLDLFTTSSLTQPKALITPTYLRPITNEAKSSHVKAFKRLSKTKTVQFSSVLQEDPVSSNIDSSSMSLLIQPMSSAMLPNLRSLLEETTACPVGSFATLKLTEPTPSSMSPQIGSALKTESFAKLVETLPSSFLRPSSSSSSSLLSSSLSRYLTLSIEEKTTTSSANDFEKSSSYNSLQLTRTLRREVMTTHPVSSSKREATSTSLSSISLHLTTYKDSAAISSSLSAFSSFLLKKGAFASILESLSSSSSRETIKASMTADLNLAMKEERATGHTHFMRPSMVKLKRSTPTATSLVSKSSTFNKEVEIRASKSSFTQFSRSTTHYQELPPTLQSSLGELVEHVAVTPWITTALRISMSLEEPGVSLPMASSYKKQHMITTTRQTLSMPSSTLEAETTKLNSPTLTLAPAKETKATTRASIKEETTSSLVNMLIHKPTTSRDSVATSTARSPTDRTTELSVATPPAVEQCAPCENPMRRSKAYCTSDYVVHVKILTEAINEFSLDTNYRVIVIHSFKMTTALPKLRSVWILNNLCHCPLLLPGKEYLLMGQLTMRVGLTKVIAEISRDSYVEEWRESMVSRMQDLKNRCPLITTQMTTPVATTPKSTEGKAALSTTEGTITEATAELRSEPPTLLSTTPRKPPVKCRLCRISKKRNWSYCESDFVIRARVVKSSFNNITQERKYLVKVKTVFRSVVEIKERQEIFVVNDYCQCPILLPLKQYVLMGTAEQISVTEFRLLIPPRPFVRIWNLNMEIKFKAIGDICDN